MPHGITQLRTRQRPAMWVGSYACLACRPMRAAATGSPGGRAPPNPSSALDPLGGSWLRSWGSPVTRTRDIIGATLCLAAGSSPGQLLGERWRLRREMVEREPVTDLGAFSSDGAVAAEWATALAPCRAPRCTGYRRCVRMGAPTSPHCSGSGWTARCTSAPVQPNARPRTSRRTRTACSRLDATDSMMIWTSWSSRSGRKGPGQRSVSDVDREAVAVDERSRRAVYAWWNVTMSTSLPSGSTRV